MMPSELTNALLQDIARLFTEADDYDTIVNVGTGSDSENFKAHSVILRARSPYFRTALSKNWARKEGDFLIFSKPNITPNVFKFILKYIYTGTCSFASDNQDIYLDIIVAADELALFDLASYVQNHIISNEFPWLQQNIVKVLNVSSSHEILSTLLDCCNQLIRKKPGILFRSDDFYTFKGSALTSILERDDLEMKEIEIWDQLITWGIRQEPELDADITRWTDQTFETLRIRLENFIQHVRFHNITSQQFYEKIWPMKCIIPQYLIDELLRFYLVPGSEVPKNSLPIRKNPSASTIITNLSLLAILKNWIDGNNKIDVDDSNNLHELKLLLRGSRDGMDIPEFFDRCANIGPTIVIIKVKNSDSIIGGYNPLPWMSTNDYQETTRSFIFSFKKIDTNKHYVILSRVSTASRAIRDSGVDNYWIGFGCGDLSWFIGSCEKDSYERNILDSNNFLIDDYEVFQVI